MTDVALPWMTHATNSNISSPLLDETDIRIVEDEESGFALSKLVMKEDAESPTSIYSQSSPLKALEDTERWLALTSSVGTKRREAISAEQALERLEAARLSLGLKVDLMAAVVGASPRRYQEWRKGDPVPRKRLPHLVLASSFMTRLLRTDPWAASSLFERDREVVALLARGAFAEAFERFNSVQDELQASFTPATDLIWSTPLSAAEMLQAVSTEAVQQVLRALEAILPETRAATEAWRLETVSSLKEAVHSLIEDNEVAMEWAWLTDLTNAQVRHFEAESEKRLQNRHFRGDDWATWLKENQDRAAANVAPLVEFEPVDPVPFPPPSPRTSSIADLRRLRAARAVRLGKA